MNLCHYDVFVFWIEVQSRLLTQMSLLRHQRNTRICHWNYRCTYSLKFYWASLLYIHWVHKLGKNWIPLIHHNLLVLYKLLKINVKTFKSFTNVWDLVTAIEKLEKLVSIQARKNVFWGMNFNVLYWFNQLIDLYCSFWLFLRL